MKCTFELTSKGYIKQRESYDLEFKQSFHYGDSLAEYGKSLVGMANHRGGELIFGIKDSPRIPLGLKNDRFENCDQKIISQFLMKYFSHEISWHMESVEVLGKQFGRIWVEEALEKPIICTRLYKNILREAAIYYRYRAETKEIKYPELARLLVVEKEKEKLLWMQHIDKINKVGPRNIHLLDTFNGEIETGSGKILIDKNLAENLKFIKEGQFAEKEGFPTLKLIGEITGIVDPVDIPKTDVLYPFRFTDFKNKLGINNYEFRAILWKLSTKGNPRYHTEISTGKNTSIHKYTKDFFDRLKSILERYPEWKENTIKEFKENTKIL